MKGGMKFYRGAGAAARNYVESDHHRADDYYLAEGTGIAEMVEISGTTGAVSDRVQMDGDTYEQWVEGIDTRTGLEKGNVQRGEGSKRPPLRFAEVIVNGPKSWSLAAGMHPDISLAYDAAQRMATEEIGKYVAANATTRVGGRGQQQQVPIEALEMAVIGHFTSRAGDPHRHIHLQFNARVPAAGAWRGIDSAAMLRMQRAINGIGHRAVIADTGFREALAAHGYTMDDEGEIIQLAVAVKPMSKRSNQVAANLAAYETEWRETNPGQEPGPDLRRAWDLRAWGDGREAKKNHPTRGEDCEAGWLSELRELGVDIEAHLAGPAVQVAGVLVGKVDRDATVRRTLKVLGAGARGRSTWNVFDVRGVAEEVLADLGVIGDRAALTELAEDVAARAAAESVSVVKRDYVPDHIRHLTSREVIAKEKDLKGRLAVRGASEHHGASVAEVAAAERAVGEERGQELRLDEGQTAAARAIAGSGGLVLIEGAAGAGKTSVLSAAAQMIQAQGHRMMVVAPTKKAAMVAGEEVGADASTAAGLAYAHGWRWDRQGVWSKLRLGDVDPVTGVEFRGAPKQFQIAAGDTLVIDEGGMLDQDTARALLHIADAAGARMVFVGDRQQLPAIGRGGVLDQVAIWTPVQVELAGVHRFRTEVEVEPGVHQEVVDTEYAALSLRMRSGEDPADVFDDLDAGGHVMVWDTEADALGYLADRISARVVSGTTQAVAVDSNDQASAINEVVRERLVSVGVVDDTSTTHGSDGLRMGVGDVVMTRKNDNQFGVANRMSWTVEGISPDGSVDLYNAGRQQHSTVPADYVREFVHLAYASTVHGVQGETADTSDLVIGDTTDAAGAYVGMTRGRRKQTVHIVATNLTEAKQKWIDAASRDRADLGLDQARQIALREAARYSPVEPSRITRPTFADQLATLRHGGVVPAQETVGEETFAEAMNRLSQPRPAPDVDLEADSAEVSEELEHRRQQQHRRGPRQ